MTHIETLSKQSYDFYTYQVDKITSGSNYSIVLKNLSRSPYGVCAVFKCKIVNETISSSLLNWHNLFFCSNGYGPSPHLGYMNHAVQNGTKPASTAYVSAEEYAQLICTLPANCHAVPYGESADNLFIAYIYRDGSLHDFFDFEKIKHIYSLHGLNKSIDWNYVKERFEKPLEYFSNAAQCGFNIQCGVNSIENKIVNGILLGYPVESTISYINGDYRCFGDSCINSTIRTHFKKSTEPYVDQQGTVWNKDGKTIYCNGQQEKLYYELSSADEKQLK